MSFLVTSRAKSEERCQSRKLQRQKVSDKEINEHRQTHFTLSVSPRFFASSSTLTNHIR